MNQHLIVEYLFHYLCCMKMKDPDKVSLIYSATLNLVRQNGLTGLTMAAIGKEAQMGMGTIYVYFKSKEELINSLFKRLKSLNTSRIYAPIAPHAPFMLNMRQLYESYLQNRIDFYEEHFFVEQCSNSHFLDEESRRLDAAAFEGVFALLERGKQEMMRTKASTMPTAALSSPPSAVTELWVSAVITLSLVAVTLTPPDFAVTLLDLIQASAAPST